MESAALPSSEPKQVLLIAVSWSCKCLALRKPTIKTHDERWLTPPALHSTVREVDVFAPCRPWAPMEFPTCFPLLKWGWRVWADERVKAGERRDAQVGSSSPRDSLPVPARFCSAQPFPTGSSSHQPGPWSRHCCKPCCLRPRDRWGDTAGGPGTEPSPTVPLSRVSPRLPHACTPHHRRCWGAGPWVRRRHLDLGESMSTWSSQGEGRPGMWSLPGRGFLAGTLGPALWHCKGKQEKQTFCPQAPLRPEASLGKTRQRWKGLCGVSCSSWFLSFLVLHGQKAVLPPCL